MKTLILPDIHLDWKSADDLINKSNVDKIIFLGDFFDDFDDSDLLINEMCDWLYDSTKQSNRIHLFGNHDMHYAFSSYTFKCSGYETWKHNIIYKKFKNKQIWNKFKYYYILDNKWILSHAGIHNDYIPSNILDSKLNNSEILKNLSTYLDNEILQGHKNNSWIFGAGYARGGNQKKGGITWCDFNNEFFPTQNINQIFGHTPLLSKHPNLCQYYDNKISYHILNNQFLKIHLNKSYNICLDVYNSMYGLIWDGYKLQLIK